jgi:hypothetical protein
VAAARPASGMLFAERDPNRRPFGRGLSLMLYPIVVVLLLLWALGMVSSFTLGGLLHLLLVVVVVLLVARLLAGRGAATM